MLKLLKGGYCYSPEDIGLKDIYIAGDKIFKISDSIPEERLWETEIIDCRDMVVCPGFIDQHVHITGGGGEKGPSSRIPEIMLGDISSAGVSTLVGVLGFDSITRNVDGLLSKARALQEEGINTYIYTGSYGTPTATLMGKVIKDIANIDKVIGVGEIAISDYRSSHPTVQMLKELAWEVKAGAMISGKKGVMHIHVGDGKEGLGPLTDLLNSSDFPVDMFIPTHLNRNRNVFKQAIEYANSVGYIDLTAGEVTGKGYSVPDAMEIFLSSGADIERVSVSSDGNGSIPGSGGNGESVGKVAQLFEDIKTLVLNKHFNIGVAIRPVTSNVAKILGIYPRKGALKEGSDADILVLEKESFRIHTLIVNGRLVIDKGRTMVKGTYEN